MFFTIWKIPFNNILMKVLSQRSQYLSYHMINMIQNAPFTHTNTGVVTPDAIHSEMNPKKQAVALPLQLKGPKTFQQHSEGDV